MSEQENIELRSKEVQEILGRIPSRIIRYGIGVIVSVLVVLFVGSFFFKYPDILKAQAEIITQNPPADIVAKSSGELTHLLVQDTQLVVRGQVLGVIQSAANFQHIQVFDSIIRNLETTRLNNFEIVFEVENNWQLGEVQSEFSLYKKSYFDLRNFNDLAIHQKKIQALKAKHIKLQEYATVLKEQWQLMEKGYYFSEQQFERDSLLFTRDVLSQSDLEKAKQKLYNDKMAVYNAHVNLINSQIEIDELAQIIIEETMAHELELDELSRKLNQSFSLLKSRLEWWFDAYLLRSPISGRVVFNEVWSSFQYVEVGQQVFTVVPDKKQQIIGKVKLPIQGAGKVKVGQTVNLKFDQFPYQEFGMITTKVKKISLVQSKAHFMLELDLPEKLISNYGIEIPFNQKMQANAEIITEDLPLIARIFNPLKSMFKEHVAH